VPKFLDIKANSSDGLITLYAPNTNTTLSWESWGGDLNPCPATGDWAGVYPPIGSNDLGALSRGTDNPGFGKIYTFGLRCGVVDPFDTVQVKVMQLPQCTITTDKATVTPPDVAKLTWSCRYAEPPTCTITDPLEGLSTAVRVTNDASYRSGGSLNVRPKKKGVHVYSLSCAGMDGVTPPSVSTTVTIGGFPIKIKEDIP
jgi:hypothetical protein